MPGKTVWPVDSAEDVRPDPDHGQNPGDQGAQSADGAIGGIRGCQLASGELHLHVPAVDGATRRDGRCPHIGSGVVQRRCKLHVSRSKSWSGSVEHERAARYRSTSWSKSTSWSGSEQRVTPRGLDDLLRGGQAYRVYGRIFHGGEQLSYRWIGIANRPEFAETGGQGWTSDSFFI